MPELPEVETVVHGLRREIVGRTIEGADVLWHRSVDPPDPDRFVKQITGKRVLDVWRRGKWIVLSLSAEKYLLIHLRMTGRLIVESEDCLDTEHLRVLFFLDDGRLLRFTDMRKFGRLRIVEDPETVLGALGPEPLSPTFTVDRFEQMLSERRGRIKPLLLNQRFLAGLGNIYVDESLWRAGIHPLRAANSLSSEEVERLHRAIGTLLRSAIRHGGTTLSERGYRRVRDQPGAYAGELIAYGREGEPCPRCSTAIERIKVSQRGTHFCPVCQPVPQEEP